MNKEPNTLKVIVLLILIHISCRAHTDTLYECVSNGVKSYQDKPCDKQQTLANNQQTQNPGRYEAIYKKLDTLAAQGYGISQTRKPKAQPKPSVFIKKSCGEPEGWRANDTYRRCVSSALSELTKGKNAIAKAQLSRHYDNAKYFCGTKWNQSPYIGMTDEDFTICSRRSRIKQEIRIDNGGVFATLYILDNENNNKVYSIDSVITKIETSSKNRSFK
jgi:hypothetical protein